MDELFEEVSFYGIEELLNKLEAVRVNSCSKITHEKLLQLVNLSQKPLQLPGLKLSAHPLSYLDLRHANMRGCDFSSCVMIEINLEQAMLISCNFNDVNLKNSNLRNTIVSHSSFVGASLYGV